MTGPDSDDTSVGGEEPGGPVPPYEGRRESADVDEGGSVRDGANIGGATGPRTTDQAADDPDSSPLGRTASPAEDDPTGNDPTTDVAGYDPDPGGGPAHQAGVRRGEDEPE